MAGTYCEDLSEDLRLALQRFEDTGIPVQTWTTTELARHFIPTKSFVENVETITFNFDEFVHDNIMYLAIQRGFWTEHCKCIPTTMMKLCNFFKSKEGSQILDDFQKKSELSMDDYFNNWRYAWKLSFQLSKFAARRSWTAEIEADIAEQRRQIVLLEKKLEKGIAEVKSFYLPASQYVPLDEQELLKRCYNMHVAKTIKSEELDQELIEFIKSEYEKDVIREHMSDFMADEKRRLLLNVWTG